MLALALTGLALPLRAQLTSTDLPQFDVFVGFDSIVPEADWFPVVCEVRNEGPAFNAIFELRDNTFGGGLVRQVAIELPTGTLKRFSFPLFAGSRYGSQFSASLRDESGRVVAQQPNINPRFNIGWQSHLLGAIPASSAAMPVFPDDTSRNNNSRPVAVAARLQTEMFPDNPLALSGLDSLYLNSHRAVDLKERQVEALLSWLHAGGHLIIGIDAAVDVTGLPWLKALVPGELGSVRTVPIGNAFDEWLRTPPAANTEPQQRDRQIFRNLQPEAAFNDAGLRVISLNANDARRELAVGNQPLMVATSRGRGRVTVLLFNPELEPLRSWKLRPWFWARLAEVPPFMLQNQLVPNQGYTGVDGVIGAMVDSRQVRKLPVSALLGLLVVYLLVIGPLDQWWLKRINRQMLTWITFPCYVALFSVLIWFIGYRLRAGESEWNEIQFVDVLPKAGGAELSGTSYASIYSPVNARYELAGKQRYAALRGEYLGAVATHATEGNIRLAADQYAATLSVPVWTSQMFVGQWLEEGPSPFGATIRKAGAAGEWELALTNHELPGRVAARLAIGDRVYVVTFPERGKTTTISLGAGGGTLIKDFANSASTWFANAASQRQQGFGSDEARFNLVPADASMAITLASNIEGNQGNQFGQFGGRFLTPSRLDLSGLLHRNRAVLMVWCEGYVPTKEAMNQFVPRRTGRSTLFRLAVELK